MSEHPQKEETPLDTDQNIETQHIEDTPEETSKFAWKESLTDKVDDDNTESDNVNRVQSFTGYHLQFKTWKKE